MLQKNLFAAKIVYSMYYYVDLQNIFYLKKYSLNYYPIWGIISQPGRFIKFGRLVSLSEVVNDFTKSNYHFDKR